MGSADYQRQRAAQRRRDGKCVCCREDAAPGRSYCTDRLKSRKEYAAKHHKKTVDDGKCSACHNRPALPGLVSCEDCRRKQREESAALKIRVLSHYGSVCVCCGEGILAFLTLDHINGDGQYQRNIIGEGSNFYRWLEKNGFPQGDLQVLCFNCNCGRQVNGGICPHQETKV